MMLFKKHNPLQVDLAPHNLHPLPPLESREQPHGNFQTLTPTVWVIWPCSLKMEKKKIQIVQMGLCDINNSLGGVLEPQSVIRAKNHKVSAQAIENVWQAAMTWGSTAVQRGLREVADWGLVHLPRTARSPRARGRRLQGTIPRIFRRFLGSRLRVGETRSCVSRWVEGSQ